MDEGGSAHTIIVCILPIYWKRVALAIWSKLAIWNMGEGGIIKAEHGEQ